MIGVLAPDSSSGEAFDRVLQSMGIETAIMHVRMAPRVRGESLSGDIQVARDLARAVRVGVAAGYTKMALACNTAQLWLPSAWEMMPEYGGKVTIYTSIDAAVWKYPARESRPVWLGTTPLCRAMPRYGFPTLLSMGEGDLQRLVQEIVWRVKGVTGVDVSGGVGWVKGEITSERELKVSVAKLVKSLEERGIYSIILGCTELPIAWERYVGSSTIGKGKMEMLDPAVFVGEQIKAQVLTD